MGLITAEELAKRLSLSPGTIKRWGQEGVIPRLRLSGKVVRFDAEEVEEVLRRRAIKEREIKSGGSKEKR